MIIEGLLSIVSGLLGLLLTPVSLPGLPDSFMDNLDEFFDSLGYAETIIPLVFPIDISGYLFIAAALFIFHEAFPPLKFIMSKIIDLIP